MRETDFVSGFARGLKVIEAFGETRQRLSIAEAAKLTLEINDSTFRYGAFLNAVISFVTIAAAVFFFVVKPLNVLAARRAAGAPTEDPTTRPCPECLSEIPVAARRCAFCTTEVAAA